jgi:hypothetical protein
VRWCQTRKWLTDDEILGRQRDDVIAIGMLSRIAVSIAIRRAQREATPRIRSELAV